MAEAKKNTGIQKTATSLPHVFLIDWFDDGIVREVAVVKESNDGTIFGILVDQLHNIDKARLKKVLSSVHSDKYPLYELLSQSKLSNGLNALDYFHLNAVKQKRPKGAKLTQDSLANVSISGISDRLVGSDFSNPSEVNVDTASKTW